MLVDSHCHLDLILERTPEDTAEAIVARAMSHGVRFFLNVCVSIAEFPTILATAERFSQVAASVGLHPNAQDEEVDADTLLTLANHAKVVAIGETGLDYFRTQGEVAWQQERLRTHIAVAKQVKKPLIIHTRAASKDTIAILRAEQAHEAGGVMHCFSEDLAFAKQALDLGFYISFSGNLTFKNATAIQEVAKTIPLERILLETDAPYLAPMPLRGKINEPSFIQHTARFLAQLRHISDEVVASTTTANFFALFQGAQKPYV